MGKKKANTIRISTGELEARSAPVWIPDHVLLEVENSQFRPAKLTQEHKEAIAKAQLEKEAWLSPNKSLEGREILYKSNPPTITVDGDPLFLNPSDKWALLGICMFAHSLGEFVDWTDIYKAMTNHEAPDGSSDKQNMVKERRMVMDAADKFNEKVQNRFNTKDNMISRQEYSLCRVFGTTELIET